MVNTSKSAVLATSFPNPFAASATIRYELESNTDVNISVFDRTGKMVQTIVDQNMDAGVYEALFEAQNLPTGLYFAKITTNGGKSIQVLKLVKQ